MPTLPKDNSAAYAAFAVKMDLATELLAMICEVSDKRAEKAAIVQSAETVRPST